MTGIKELFAEFNKIYIQTHNYPDADAIASAWGMKKLAEKLGKKTEIIYHGRNIFKPNINNLISKYRIKLRLIGEGFAIDDRELLLIVDGQYGTGNVLQVGAKNIAVIDHHLEEGSYDYLYRDIQPRLGACTTIIYQYLKNDHMEIESDLSTILYYGIFMDTDMFTGRITTLDNDARQELEVHIDKKIIDYLRLSSIAFDDLQIFANGILKTERYNNMIFSSIDECDDNLLGHISDLFSEIDGIEIVVVYSPRLNGYKLSIRSYHDFITAEELIKWLTEEIGSGGGHAKKAGGMIFIERFNQLYQKNSIGLFIKTRVSDYCREVRLLETGKDDPIHEFGREKFFKAQKRGIYLRYLELRDYFEEDVTIQTLEGVTSAAMPDKVIIGVKGEIWPISPEAFTKKYLPATGGEHVGASDEQLDEYGVTIRSNSKVLRITKENIQNFNLCQVADPSLVDVIRLDEKLKVRTTRGDFTAKKDDYLIMNSPDDYFVCEREIFELTYRVVE